MQRIVWILCCYHLLVVAVGAAVSGASVRGNWQSWKEEHGKQYSSEMEDTQKLRIWMDNLALIEDHNSQNHRFTLAMNHFGDMVY